MRRLFRFTGVAGMAILAVAGSYRAVAQVIPDRGLRNPDLAPSTPPLNAAKGGEDGRPETGPETGPKVGSEAGAKREVRPEYWKDARLAAEVRFPLPKVDLPPKPLFLHNPEYTDDPKEPGALEPVRVIGGRTQQAPDVLAAIQQQTGARLLLAGEWGHDWLVMPVAGGPAREVMDSFARVYRGRWFRARDAWVLANTLAEVRMVMMSKEERVQAQDACAQALFQGLNPAQMQRLGETNQLEFGELGPRLQRVVLDKVALWYYDPDWDFDAAPAREALRGRGISLSLIGKGVDISLKLSVPGRLDEPVSIITPFYDPVTKQPRWGVLPPR